MLGEKNAGRRFGAAEGPHRFRRAAAAEGDHRGPAGLGFHRHDAEVFLRREEHGPAAAVVVADDIVRLPAEECDVRAGLRLQLRQFLPAANDDEPAAEPLEGLDREIEPLVRGERRDDQVEVFTRHRIVRRVEVGFDRWMNHGAVAAVAVADPLPNGLADGDEMRDPIRRAAIPIAHSGKQSISEFRFDPALAIAEVLAALVPGIAHRREAVADVGHAGRGDGPLGDAVAEAEDEIDIAEAMAGRHRHERQEVAVVARPAGQGVQPAGADAESLDRGRDGPAPVQQCAEFGVRPADGRRFEALLPAAHPGQPVVHQGEAGRSHAVTFSSACRSRTPCSGRGKCTLRSPGSRLRCRIAVRRSACD